MAALLEVARTQDLLRYQELLSEAPAGSWIITTKSMTLGLDDPTRNLAMRLHPGEAGAVRSAAGWNVVQRVKPLPAPPDAAKPPSDVVRPNDGFAYRMVTATGGSRHPDPNSKVRLHVDSWTSAGAMIDSTVLSGASDEVDVSAQPAPVAKLIESLAVGDKMRVWISEASGAVSAVADIELIDILPPGK